MRWSRNLYYSFPEIRQGIASLAVSARLVDCQLPETLQQRSWLIHDSLRIRPLFRSRKPCRDGRIKSTGQILAG